MQRFVSTKSRVGFPSIRYPATVNGPPQNPTSARSGSSCGAHEPHGLEDERHRLLGIGDTERLDVCGRAHRLVDHRADVLDELDVDPHAEDRQHDVGEHDCGVDPVDTNGLERHLGAELRLPADLEQVVALADLAVAGQRAPRLAHEPDRSPLDRLQARGPDEEWCGH